MKRVVYFREADERLLEERGLDAKAWLRQTVADGFQALREAEVAPARGSRARRSSAAAAKGCSAVLPPGTFHKDCGEVH